MLGRSGLFRQQNIEKRRVYSLREWFEVRLIVNMEYGVDCYSVGRLERRLQDTQRGRSAEQG